ncbi:MAG: Crp/Fnr family transcriptional regulator [Bacteroidota bacterium]
MDKNERDHSTNNKEKIIRHIKRLVAISEDHLAVIVDKLDEKRFAKKEHILYSETFANKVYFTLKGCQRTYLLDYNGVEHNISFSMEDWWFGDLQSFINKTPACFNIQALEETVVLSINWEDWHFLIKAIPEFVTYTRILFRNTMFAHENRIVQNLSYTAEERYHYFLDKYPQFAQRISQKHIASYIGITPEFLSMLRKKRKS